MEHGLSYKALLDAFASYSWTTDEHGLAFGDIDSFASFTGCSSESLVGSGWVDAVHKEDQARALAGWQESIKNVVKHEIEIRVKHHAGGYRWVQAIGVPVLKDGRLIGWTGIGIDIHERRMAQERLAASESRFRALADSTPHLIWAATPEGVVDYYNSRAADYDGVERLPDGTYAWRAVLHDEDLASTEAAWRQAMASGEQYEAEHRVRMRDGSFRWHVSRALPQRDSLGAIIRWFGTATDVHALKMVEHALRSASQEARRHLTELETIYRSVPIGLCVLDQDLRFVRINDHQAAFNGLPPSEHIGRTVAEVVPRLAPTIVPVLENILRTGEPVLNIEVVGRTAASPDRDRTWIASWLPIIAPDGSTAGVNVVSEDVTELRQAQAELSEHRIRLEQLVHERTSQLEATHRKLRLSERMALIGTLSAGLGHDMGNLLLPIRMRLDSLMRMEPSGPAQADLNAIRSATEYLHRLSAGLRMLALDPEQASRANEATELTGWMAELEPFLRHTLPRAIRLDTSIEASLPPVAIAPHHLAQVLYNLVQNAGEAMGQQTNGLVRINVSRDGDEVVVRVQDNGPGMTPAVVDRCIEPFFTTKTRSLSTGMGLSLVNSIISKAQGRVGLQSAPGVGTLFTIHLPAAVAERPTGAGVTAIVELRDARLSSFTRAVLGGLGIQAATAEAGANACIWITDDAPGVEEAAERFVSNGPPQKAAIIMSDAIDPFATSHPQVRRCVYAQAASGLRRILTELMTGMEV